MDINSLAPLMEFLKQYNQIIQEQVEQRKPVLPPYRNSSDSINELATALAKAQADYLPLDMNDINPYTKQNYAEYNDIIKSVREALTKNNLALTQIRTSLDDGQTMLYTRLIHTSGQWLECSTRIIPPLEDLHTYESMINHYKKIDAMALLNITAAHDSHDDDGERAMQKLRNKEVKGTDLDYQYKPKGKSSSTTISKDHLEELEIELDDCPDLVKGIYSANHIESLADLPEIEYRTTVDRIRKIKKVRQENECK